MRDHVARRGAGFDPTLVAFATAHRDTPTLTAWIAGGMTDPADRRHWRVALTRGIAGCRRAFHGGPSVEVEPFEAAVRALQAVLPGDETVHACAGTVIFATSDGATLVLPVDIAPAASVTWQAGPRIAPWLAVAPLATAVVAIADRQHATLYRLESGVSRELERVDVQPVVEPVPHMGSAPRRGFHTGTRGTTNRDAAARRLRESRERHAATVAERIIAHAGPDADVVLGGVRETGDLIVAALPAAFRGRFARMEARARGKATKRTAAPDITPAAERALGMLESSRQGEFARTLVDSIGTGGHVAAGLLDVIHALERRAVDHILVSPSLIRRHPATVDRLIQESIAEGGVVEVARAETVVLLDDRAGGIIARLRFPVPSTARARPRTQPRRKVRTTAI